MPRHMRSRQRRRRTVGQDCQKCEETSSPLADKQQKMGEHVKTISTFSPVFCCLSTRGPDVRKIGKHYSDVSEILEMEQNAPCFSPHIL